MKSKTLESYRIILYTLRDVGFDPIRTFKAFRNLPRYLLALARFLLENGFGGFRIAPTLTDMSGDAGITSGHYFWQDLLCAQWVKQNSPKEHFDVGSRLDGFIAHLLVFMDVNVLDLRAISSEVSGLTFIKGDITTDINLQQFASVSSLHAIEHFGLGRYGDQIGSNKHLDGLRNLSKLVSESGNLYISFPIGQSEVQFNSQRIIHPMWPVQNLPDFELEEFVLIPWSGTPTFGLSPESVDLTIAGQAGLYRFKRKSSDSGN